MGIIWNNSQNMTIFDDVLIENDTIYKVLLYVAIMAIILILALGLYFITANKVCPDEFENDDDGARDNEERERERRRRRRRRRHRRRHRSSHRHRNSINSNSQQMIELNEPIIQSAVNPLSINNNENNNNNQSPPNSTQSPDQNEMLNDML